MRPEQQLRLLTKIWGRRDTGYVFLPYIPADVARTPQRKQNWHEGPAFEWPRGKDKILAHLAAHVEDDLYFAPMIFTGKARRAELAATGNRLWADLDEADPNKIEERYKPTHAWETSPGRYAAVWVMNEHRPEVSMPGMENQRLTHYLGADPSGWDTTQLLRVPGSANNKPDKPEGTRGKLVWADRELHEWDTFESLPHIEVAKTIDDTISEEMLKGVDRHAVYARVRLQLPKNIRAYMRLRDTSGMDRSETAWQIERELADAGCTLAEIVAVMQPTVWNKFAGRQDELKRLVNECAKAVAARKEKPEELEVVDDTPKPEGLMSFQDDGAFLQTKRPAWLVRDLWSVGGVGFIAGAPKSMKSWLALDLAFTVASRGDYWGHTVPRSRNVLYIQQEDDASTVKQRLGLIVDSKDDRYHWDGVMRLKGPSEVMWEPPTRTPSMLSVQVQSGFIASDEGWQAWLAEMVETHDIGLVVMDTLTTVSGGIDTDNAREVKSMMLDPIKRIARAHNCAMILVHHNTKGGQNNRGAMNMAGSGQIHAWADCGIYVHSREGNELKVEIETKFGPNRTTHLSLESLEETDEGRGLWLPREVVKTEEDMGVSSGRTNKGMRDPKTGQKRDKTPQYVKDKQEAKALRLEKLKELVADGTTSHTELAQLLNVSKDTIRRDMKTLRDS